MAISNEKAGPLLLVILAVLAGYVGYSGTLIDMAGLHGVQARHAEVKATQDTLATITAQTDSAKRELATGTVEDLRNRIENYRSSLVLLRRLVPERTEVPNLLDDISTRARIRGVTLSAVVPQGEEEGPTPFSTDKYTVQVIGHYDQIGQFLADVASLQRIIVPFGVTLSAANPTSAKALGDSTGALLEAKFQIRTYVKSANPDAEGATSGT